MVFLSSSNPAQHRLRTPNEAFFQQNPKLLGLGRQLWGIWGIFEQFISTHFGTVSPLSMLCINQPLFLQMNKPLNPNLKYLFGVGI